MGREKNWSELRERLGFPRYRDCGMVCWNTVLWCALCLSETGMCGEEEEGYACVSYPLHTLALALLPTHWLLRQARND
jgi:hypothetical protein